DGKFPGVAFLLPMAADIQGYAEGHLLQPAADRRPATDGGRPTDELEKDQLGRILDVVGVAQAAAAPVHDHRGIAGVESVEGRLRVRSKEGKVEKVGSLLSTGMLAVGWNGSDEPGTECQDP